MPKITLSVLTLFVALNGASECVFAQAQSSKTESVNNFSNATDFSNQIENLAARTLEARTIFFTPGRELEAAAKTKVLFFDILRLYMGPFRQGSASNAISDSQKRQFSALLDESRALYSLTAYETGDTFELIDKTGFYSDGSLSLRIVWDVYTQYQENLGSKSTKTISAGLALLQTLLLGGKTKFAQQQLAILEPTLRELGVSAGQTFVEARILEITLLQERGLFDRSIALTKETIEAIKGGELNTAENISRLNLLVAEAYFQSWDWKEAQSSYLASYDALSAGNRLGTYFSQSAAGGIFASNVLMDNKKSFSNDFDRYLLELKATSDQMNQGARESAGLKFFKDVQKTSIARFYDEGASDGLLKTHENITQLSRRALGQNHPMTMEMEGLLGALYSSKGRKDDARNLYSGLVSRIEEYRSDSSIDREDRQAVFAKIVPIYKLYSWAEQQSNPENAFFVSELSKARTLLESMLIGRAFETGIMSQEDAESVRKADDDLSKLRHYASIAQTPEEKDKFRTARDHKQKEQENLIARLSEKYPQMREMQKVSIASAAVGSKALKLNEVFLSYISLDKVVVIFTLDSHGNLKSYESNASGNLQNLIQAYREKLELDALGRSASKRTFVVKAAPGNSRVESEQQQILNSTEDALAKLLYKILIKPVENDIRQAKHLVIAPDGPLALFPFEVLMNEQGKRLIEVSNISYTQSLSVLTLTRERESRSTTTWDSDIIAVGGAIYKDETKYGENPYNIKMEQALNWTLDKLKTGTQSALNWFGSTLNVSGKRSQTTDYRAVMIRNSDDPAIVRNAFMSLNLKWDNLPGAEEEVKSVTKVFDVSRSSSLLGINANENQLKKLNQNGDLTRYRYLLFSGHGYLSTDEPSLSALVLSLVPEALSADSDGYLTASELAGFNLKNDLVALSACETGVGKVVAGEGVLGIPFGIYLAGGRSTAMSLWRVADDSTKDFMVEFFKKLKNGVNKSEAMAETKREFIKNKYSAPFYWAPFVLYGN